MTKVLDAHNLPPIKYGARKELPPHINVHKEQLPKLVKRIGFGTALRLVAWA